jgi:hypothetical protein
MGSDFEHQSMLAMPFALEVARCLVRMSKRQPPRGRNATMGFSLLNLDSQLHNAMQCRGHREKLLQRILISFYEKRKFWGWQRGPANLGVLERWRNQVTLANAALPFNLSALLRVSWA